MAQGETKQGKQAAPLKPNDPCRASQRHAATEQRGRAARLDIVAGVLDGAAERGDDVAHAAHLRDGRHLDADVRHLERR